jgi:hypothetical protein
VVETRELVLMKHQFLPIPFGMWKASTGDIFGPRMYMAYVYTFIPQSTYRNILANVSAKFLDAGYPEHRPSPEEVRKMVEHDLARVNL